MTDSVALEPKLSRDDVRILKYLSETWRSAWEVAEHINEEDVRLVRQTLDALRDFHYVMSTHRGGTKGRHAGLRYILAHRGQTYLEGKG